jgi:hypothetical protein
VLGAVGCAVLGCCGFWRDFVTHLAHTSGTQRCKSARLWELAVRKDAPAAAAK